MSGSLAQTPVNALRALAGWHLAYTLQIPGAVIFPLMSYTGTMGRLFLPELETFLFKRISHSIAINSPTLNQFVKLRWTSTNENHSDGVFVLSFKLPDAGHCVNTTALYDNFDELSLSEVLMAIACDQGNPYGDFKVYVYPRFHRGTPRVYLRSGYDDRLGKAYYIEAPRVNSLKDEGYKACYISSLFQRKSVYSDEAPSMAYSHPEPEDVYPGSSSGAESGQHDARCQKFLPVPLDRQTLKAALMTADPSRWPDFQEVASLNEANLIEVDEESAENLPVSPASFAEETLKGTGMLRSLPVSGNASLVVDFAHSRQIKISLSTDHDNALQERLDAADRERGMNPKYAAVLSASYRLAIDSALALVAGKVNRQVEALLSNGKFKHPEPVGKGDVGQKFRNSFGSFDGSFDGCFDGSSDNLDPELKRQVVWLMEWKPENIVKHSMFVMPVFEQYPYPYPQIIPSQNTPSEGLYNRDYKAERSPILINPSNGMNELVMAATRMQSIPKLYPIVGLSTSIPGIALPEPPPLDLPKIVEKKKVILTNAPDYKAADEPSVTPPLTHTLSQSPAEKSLGRIQPYLLHYTNIYRLESPQPGRKSWLQVSTVVSKYVWCKRKGVFDIKPFREEKDKTVDASYNPCFFESRKEEMGIYINGKIRKYTLPFICGTFADGHCACCGPRYRSLLAEAVFYEPQYRSLLTEEVINKDEAIMTYIDHLTGHSGNIPEEQNHINEHRRLYTFRMAVRPRHQPKLPRSNSLPALIGGQDPNPTRIRLPELTRSNSQPALTGKQRTQSLPELRMSKHLPALIGEQGLAKARSLPELRKEVGMITEAKSTDKPPHMKLKRNRDNYHDAPLLEILTELLMNDVLRCGKCIQHLESLMRERLVPHVANTQAEPDSYSRLLPNTDTGSK